MNSNKFCRADIVKIITDTGIVHVNAKIIVSAIVQAMADALIAGRTIELRGFGTLEPRERKAGVRRDPRSGKAVNVPPRRRVVFRPGRELKIALRGCCP